MTTRHIYAFILIAWLMLFAGCSSLQQDLNAGQMQATVDEYIRQLDALEKTAQQMAALTNSALPTVVPLQTYEPTITKRPTLGTTNTLAPTDTATITPSPTSPAQAFISGDTNCRTGPSKSYDWVTLVETGQTVEIIGRDTSDQYYVIRNPYGEGACWLWKAYATQIVSTGRIPIFASPPTKTPTRTASNTPEPRFTIRLEQVVVCQDQESMVVRVYNSYSLPFTSWRAHIFYLPGRDFQEIVTGDQFSHDMDECSQTINSLKARSTGYAIVPFDSEKSQEFLVEFEACTLAGGNRICAFDGFKFNVQFLTATPTNTATPTRTPTRTPITPSPTAPTP